MAAFIQNIQGIRVSPSAALQASGLFSGPVIWARGYAFGGWIYNSSLRLGFSKEPTELTLSVVLEASSSNLSTAKFDISKRLLSSSLTAHGARGYFDENAKGHFYSIDMHGVSLKRMYLHDYSISIEANQKVLNVTFKDYSLILNKIYIGLTKRQGPAFGRKSGIDDGSMYSPIHSSITAAELEGYCPNCYLLGKGNTGGWGANLANFFNKSKGTIIRNLAVGNFAIKYGIDADQLNTVRGAPGAAWIGTLRKYDPTNPDIIADQACYNSASVTSSYVDCVGLYPTVWHPLGSGLWQHPRKRAGLPWEPVSVHYCTGTNNYCDGAAGATPGDCASNGGIWRVDQINDPTACIAGGFDWKHQRNLLPKEFYQDLHDRLNAGLRHPVGFTIDGGTLMLGTEEFSSKRCSDLPNVSYNFSELMESLIFHGLPMSLHTDVGSRGLSYHINKNPKFRANYVGTLREVLEQWCSAMALDYYWDSENELFRFIDLEQGADLRPIQNITDPSTAEGEEFGATQNGTSVIISYKESSSLANTQIQRVITANTKPFTKREKVKDIQRYAPILPLHPLDFTSPNYSRTNYESIYGETFTSYRYANILPWSPFLKPQAVGRRPWAEPLIPDWHEARKRIWYTNRQLWDIDYAMTLAKFNRSLREMYVGQRIIETCKSNRIGLRYNAEGAVDGYGAGAIDPEVQRDFDANCMALGFVNLGEVICPEVKTDLIAHFMGGSNDDVQDINLDQTFYKIFIGYYTKEEHEDIVAWEQRGAEQMYKNGAVIQGTLPGYPYVPGDFHGLKAGEAGFSPAGEGLSIPKLENSFSPSADTYAQCSTCLEMYDAPFNGVLVRSGNFLPTGLRFATLDNPWGTDNDSFERAFNKIFNDNACTKYNSSLNIAEEMEGMYEYKTQTWDLDSFVPRFFDDLSEAWVDLEPEMAMLQSNGLLIDEVSIAGNDINNGFRRTCKKIHLMVVTDVANHENVRFDIQGGYAKNAKARKARELWEIKEWQRKAKEEFRDYCDYDINFEFCEDAIKKDAMAAATYGAGFTAATLSNCAVSPTGVYKEGFDRNLIGGFPVRTPFGIFPHQGTVNSRALRIMLTRNPDSMTKYPRTDDMGYYYLADLEEDLDTLPTKTLDYTFVYPINNYKMYGTYGWYPGTEPFTEPTPYNQPVTVPPTFNVPIQSAFYPGGMGNMFLGPGNYQLYSGIWNAKVTVEDRIPELIEIFGAPIGQVAQASAGIVGGNPTTAIKVVNNTLDPDLEANLDPTANEFITKVYDADGSELKTVADWHSYVAYGLPGGRGLNNYDVIEPTSQIDFQLAGSVKEFPNFYANGYAHPRYGLTSYNVSLTEGGLQTSMTFASRPPVAPELEAILNKIGPRII